MYNPKMSKSKLKYLAKNMAHSLRLLLNKNSSRCYQADFLLVSAVQQQDITGSLTRRLAGHMKTLGSD